MINNADITLRSLEKMVDIHILMLIELILTTKIFGGTTQPTFTCSKATICSKLTTKRRQ